MATLPVVWHPSLTGKQVDQDILSSAFIVGRPDLLLLKQGHAVGVDVLPNGLQPIEGADVHPAHLPANRLQIQDMVAAPFWTPVPEMTPDQERGRTSACLPMCTPAADDAAANYVLTVTVQMSAGLVRRTAASEYAPP